MNYAFFALPAVLPVGLLAWAYTKLRPPRPRTFSSEAEWAAFEAGR